MRVRFQATFAPIALGFLLACSRADESRVQEAHEDEGHADAGHVELTEAQFRSAGIELVAVGPGQVHDALTLAGTIAPNADAVMHVTPRVSGQVRLVSKNLGERVESGELLCVIDSVELGEAVAEYLRDLERVRAAQLTIERETSLLAERLEALRSVLDGSVAIQERIHERERELQEKAVSTVRPLLEAEKALQLARLDREMRLTDLRAARDGRLLELDVDLRTKRIELAAAASRLRAMGLAQGQIEEIDADSPLVAGEYPIRSPGSGVIVDRHVSNGEFVEAGSKLYVLEDLTEVWFVASAFEEQLQSLRTGLTARVNLDAFPGTPLTGRVSFLDYHVDRTSRSVGVRISLDNRALDEWPEELPLRPGMFGRAELETGALDVALVLPEAALVHDDSGDFVFVQVEPFAFERRELAVRHAAGGQVEVLEGLDAGELIAVTGTFFLKSALLSGELGGGHAH